MNKNIKKTENDFEVINGSPNRELLKKWMKNVQRPFKENPELPENPKLVFSGNRQSKSFQTVIVGKWIEEFSKIPNRFEKEQQIEDIENAPSKFEHRLNMELKRRSNIERSGQKAADALEGKLDVKSDREILDRMKKAGIIHSYKLKGFTELIHRKRTAFTKIYVKRTSKSEFELV